MRFPVRVISLLFFVIGCTSFAGGDNGAKLAAEINAAKERAHSLMGSGDFQGALSELSPFAARDIKDAQLYSMLARSQWKTGAHDEAVKNFETSLRFDYTGAEAHRQFAQMLMEMGKIGRALTEFDLAVRYAPADALAFFNYGTALFEFGRKQQAVAQWHKAYTLDPTNAEFAEALGIGLSEQEPEKALEFFEKAAELGADDASFHNNFGLLLTRIGDTRAGVEFHRAVEIDPDNRAFQFNLATHYLNTQRFADAVPLFERLHDSAPADWNRRIYLARSYYGLKRFDDVIALLGYAVEQRDSMPDATGGLGIDEAYDVLAMSYRGVGDLEKAVTFMAEALDIRPQDIVHLNNYGVILAEHGMIDKAKAQWEKVLRLEPGNLVAKQNLSAFSR